MSVERAEVTQEIRRLAAEAGVELFRAYGVELELAPDGWVETDALLLSGVMGFVEEHLSGTCVLAAPRDALMATAPADARPRDWVGELTNQLVGRLKAKLMAHGLTVAVSTPVVLAGIKLSPLPRGDAEPSVYASKNGRVLIWLEVEVDPTFVWGEPEAGLAHEGDLLVF
ncbi:MAG TPA: chemotaxis protein CheX [Polyangiaceae bacterium]|nr:chemotaxis protein CheX [Polyangiaceae bacterium]